MSKATKRKHVSKEVMEEFILPTEHQKIVKIVAGRGNNLHEVEDGNGDKFLVSMPTKFRKNVWIKRGDYVIVDPIDEGDKVKAEIAVILYRDQIKYITDEGKWPPQFETVTGGTGDSLIPDDLLPPSDDEDESDNERDENVIVNVNRKQVVYLDSEEETEED